MDYELNGWNEIENILNVIFKQHNDKTNKPSTNSTRLVKYQFLIFLFSNFVWDGKMCQNLKSNIVVRRLNYHNRWQYFVIIWRLEQLFNEHVVFWLMWLDFALCFWIWYALGL